MSEEDYLNENITHGQPDWIIAQFPDGFVGNAVELGALNGVYLSNTYKLEQLGWRCLCIEPNRFHQSQLVYNRKLVLCCSCGASPRWSARVEDDQVWRNTKTTTHWDDPGDATNSRMVLTLDQCLELTGFASLDVLCLDVDGPEMEILSAFDVNRWRPRVMLLESDSPPEDIDHWARHAGYRLAKRIDADNCYIRED